MNKWFGTFGSFGRSGTFGLQQGYCIPNHFPVYLKRTPLSNIQPPISNLQSLLVRVDNIVNTF